MPPATPRVLTIAGSDSGGGAGIQADLKTFAAHLTYGMSVITAITAQNTREVRAVAATSPDLVAAQLDAVMGDIGADAVKIGMLANAEVITAVAEVLGRFRTSVAAAANGFARRALDESVRHLNARQQFGKPLAAFQGLRFDLAEMDVRLRAAQLLVDEAAERTDAGDAEGPHAVARAKLFATEAAGWICDRAVQHHGGLGVKRGTLVERLFREVRALRIYEGTSEIQKLILAKELLRGV